LLSQNICEPPKQVADRNGRSVEVQEPLKENAGGRNAAENDEPHQRPALLHKIQHAGEFSECVCELFSKLETTNLKRGLLLRQSRPRCPNRQSKVRLRQMLDDLLELLADARNEAAVLMQYKQAKVILMKKRDRPFFGVDGHGRHRADTHSCG